jgi:hypothetical protein
MISGASVSTLIISDRFLRLTDITTYTAQITGEFDESDVTMAAHLHKMLWKVPLDPLLRRVTIDLESDMETCSESFEYIPKEELSEMQLENLKWNEDVFLFRPEYKVARHTLHVWSSSSGGAAVVGQPGIGEFLL